MRTYLFLLPALLLQLCVCGQSIVHLEMDSGSKTGSGFVVAREKDTLYVVTAGHVVSEHGWTASDIALTLNNQVSTKVETVKIFGQPNTEDDIALLKVLLKDNGTLDKYTVPQIGQDVYYFSGVQQKKAPPGDPGTAELWLDKEKRYFEAYLAGVQPGDSGSALFSDEKIIGMIIQKTGGHYVKIISVMHIRERVTALDARFWQLQLL